MICLLHGVHRWPERPYLFIFSAIGALAAVVLAGSVRYHQDQPPFYMVTTLFAAAFGTMAISFWPYMIPFSITIEEAAAPRSSLAFMFWGEGCPGDALVAADYVGKGHKWRLIDDQPWRRA
jgi:cytochrome d ubiquinol oxidase subunit II